MDKIYLCIDLKSFFASVECSERGLDPLVTNLVVADPSRGQGAICLAITPAMKKLGIKNRCRLYEIPKDVSYITALPRMKYYIKYSADIYEIYLKYISREDIHVYSIDECFMDITNYLKLYRMSPKELANKITNEILDKTGITATVGIGTNLFLTKVALDITAKHVEDNMGFLNQKIFKETIWHHRPITDIWNIGRGVAKRLEKYNVYDLYGVAHMDKDVLYKEFGINAEYLIDHANGIEPCTIEEIHNYKSKSTSFSNNQILSEDYKYEDALLVLKEMVELNTLDLVDKEVVCGSIGLFIRYSKDIIKSTGGTIKLDDFTNSYKVLNEYFISLYKNTTNKIYPIRSIGISFGNIVSEDYRTYNLFTNIEFDKKERNVQEAILKIKKKYGKNSILKGMNIQEKSTTKKRNKLIGGHNSE